MQLRIWNELFDHHPDLVLGVIAVHGLDNSQDQPEIVTLLREAEASVPPRLGTGPLAEHPRIAPWREAYRRFGAKPKKYPSSIENLVKRVSKGASLAPINDLVALYNTVSLRHLLPVGGEDLAAVQGDLELAIAGGDEPAVLLLGEREPRAPYAGEIFYKDAQGAVCRRWNWKEADRTKLTHETTRAVLVVESIPPTERSELEAAVEDLAGLLVQFGLVAGDGVKTSILDRGNPIVPLD